VDAGRAFILLQGELLYFDERTVQNLRPLLIGLLRR